MATDIIILTYKPDEKFLKTINLLKKQTIKPGKIIIANTNKRYFDELMAGAEDQLEAETFLVFHVAEKDFDHGKTRNLAVTHVSADSFLMMTQDAIPADENLIENLAKTLDEKDTAVSYARQLATNENDELEKFVRNFNYGTEPLTKSKTDIDKMGIKAFFCSNVCAIYKTEIFRELGGFVERTVFNEDMIYARKAIDAGYAIRYEPKALVYHAHNYTFRQQLKRNFDLGVSHAEYPEVFSGLATESEGIKMVKSATIHLLKNGKPWLIIKLFCQSLAKYRGFRLGLRFRSLTQKKIHKYTSNPNYWKF